MIISHKHKFIFIATPKTGTTSIESKLESLNEKIKLSSDASERGNPSFKHMRKEDLEKYCLNDLNDYFTFSFSRNPWDRHLSIFKYYKKMIKFWEQHNAQKEKWKNVYKHYKKLVGKTEDFNDFVKNNPNFAELQTYWITKKINFVGKMETMQDSFDYICEKVGIDPIKLPHLNISNKIDYRTVYNDESIDIVAKSYKKDTEYLRYKFGD